MVLGWGSTIQGSRLGFGYLRFGHFDHVSGTAGLGIQGGGVPGFEGSNRVVSRDEVSSQDLLEAEVV